MEQIIYETATEKSPLGFHYCWHTNYGGQPTIHWHDEIELLYPLNGEADITIDGTKHRLIQRRPIVIDSGQVHNTHSSSPTAMFLCVHISRRELKTYMPDIDMHHIHCIPELIAPEQVDACLELCTLLEEMTRLFMKKDPMFSLRAESILLRVTATLLEHFSVRRLPESSHIDASTVNRIHDMIEFIDTHYKESLTLDAVAKHTGLSREYFCRYFKKNIGISFVQYLNEMRVSHVHYDLVRTDLSISQLMEEHGLTNQKTFNQVFKQMYGETPSAIRKHMQQTKSGGVL